MAKSKKSTVEFGRKRRNKTNYKKRLELLKSRETRLVIRKSLNAIHVQFVSYEAKGDKTLASAHSNELKKLNWKSHLGNIPSAYLTGLLAGKKALQNNIKKAILDTGLNENVKKTNIYAALKGVIDSGIEIPHKEGIFPSEEQISGKVIETYANTLLSNKEKYDKQFSGYIKKGFKPEEISKQFSEVKEKIEQWKK